MARKGSNIYLRRDGRYEGRYKMGRKEDGALKFGYVYARTRAGAQKKLREKQMKYPPALWEKTEQNIAWWMRRWLKEQAKEHISVTSCALYERRIRLHIIPAVGSMPLAQLQEDKLLRLPGILKDKGLSSSTVNQICALLNRALKQAGQEGYVEKAPVIRRLKEEKISAGKALDKRERNHLDDYLRKKNDPAVMLGAYMGLRLGEVCALKWEDLDLENGLLYIRRSVQCLSLDQQTRKLLGIEASSKTTYLVKAPKTPESSRILPIPEAVRRQLGELKLRRGCEGDGYVFGTRKSPCKPRTLQKHFAMVCKKYLNQRHGFHALRHTFATRFIENCNNPEMLRGLLGHSDISITLGCYVHSGDEEKRKAIEQMLARTA